jgi:hypothetical protein
MLRFFCTAGIDENLTVGKICLPSIPALLMEVSMTKSRTEVEQVVKQLLKDFVGDGRVIGAGDKPISGLMGSILRANWKNSLVAAFPAR